MSCAYSSCVACTAVAACGWRNGTCAAGSSGACPVPDAENLWNQYMELMLFLITLMPLAMLLFVFILHCTARVPVAPLDSAEVALTAVPLESADVELTVKN